MIFNLNDDITVKLTDLGLQHYLAWRDSEIKSIKRFCPDVDEKSLGFRLVENKLTGQAWQVFSILSSSFNHGSHPLIDMNVELHPRN